jgi:hypothetical protein
VSRLKTLICLVLVLLVVPAFAQNRSDDDVPVLKRRPPKSETVPPPDTDTQPSAPATPSTPPAQSTAPVPEPSAPMHHDHHAEMMRHGAEAMGFDQQTTSHHFTKTRSGGVVRVTANNPDDTEIVGHINVHFRTIASQFARGDFRAPELTHGQVPSGVATMQRLREKITYTAHPIAGGAELIISSTDQRAVDAIHQFIDFQIRDHETGDTAAIR